MSDFHMIVCMKVVPKPEEIRVDPESHRLLREGARSEFNPPDMNALELALSIKDMIEGRVTIISMGPPFIEDYLRLGLAMGADDAYMLTDMAFAGADTLATTYTLARGIEKIGLPSIIFSGEESSDGATGQVPPGLAEWLDLPLISLVRSLDVDLGRGVIQGRREIEGGHEILEVPIPAVISVATASNEPRFMDYDRKPWACDEAVVTKWNASDLDAEGELIGVPGSPTIVTGLEQAPSQERKNIFLEGNEGEIVEQLVRILSEI
jgi:electron transfer flavoprotein beta subunit